MTSEKSIRPDTAKNMEIHLLSKVFLSLEMRYTVRTVLEEVAYFLEQEKRKKRKDGGREGGREGSWGARDGRNGT